MNLFREPRTKLGGWLFILTLIPRVIIFAIGVCFEERHR